MARDKESLAELKAVMATCLPELFAHYLGRLKHNGNDEGFTAKIDSDSQGWIQWDFTTPMLEIDSGGTIWLCNWTVNIENPNWMEKLAKRHKKCLSNKGCDCEYYGGSE